jgi:hypothetical protein
MYTMQAGGMDKRGGVGVGGGAVGGAGGADGGVGNGFFTVTDAISGGEGEAQASEEVGEGGGLQDRWRDGRLASRAGGGGDRAELEWYKEMRAESLREYSALEAQLDTLRKVVVTSFSAYCYY